MALPAWWLCQAFLSTVLDVLVHGYLHTLADSLDPLEHTDAATPAYVPTATPGARVREDTDVGADAVGWVVSPVV